MNALQFVHVQTGQTSEKRCAVVQMSHQGICHQEGSLIYQILSDPPEIMHLNEASITNIAEMISIQKITIRHQGSLQQLLDA